MTAIHTKTGLGIEPVVKDLKRIMGNLEAGVAGTADQVVVDMVGGFIDKLTVSNVGGHDQPLFGEKAEGAVNGRFGQAG